jgi:SAM-dependent MidA family methyltransferase
VLTESAAPPPDPAETAHAGRVARAIRARLAEAGGWLPFSAFMETALYAPGLGYYVTERPMFGADGDFVTAPGLSPLFAACVANGLADLLEKTGGGDVVEVGAGDGRFAEVAFAALLARGAPVGRYRIVESSPVLADRQQRRLSQAAATSGLFGRFEWLDAPPRESWQGVAFANEVVDALPVDRFRMTPDGVEALGVVADADRFAWASRPADPGLAAGVEAIQRALPSRMTPGYASEIRPGDGAWLAGAAQTLERGAVLIVDYGLPRAQYYHPSRAGGSLCAFRRHRRVEDVLSNPGIQDLTAWVDFTALAEAGSAAGLELGGFATQAHYLIATGVERELARLSDAVVEHQRLALRQFAATLMLPGEMGERFKALALVRGIRGPFAGFGVRDLSASL